MPVTNATYADAVDRILILERNLIRARTHFERIYRNSAKTGIIEGECSVAISAINATLQESREMLDKVKAKA